MSSKISDAVMFRNCFHFFPILVLCCVIRRGFPEVREARFKKFHLCSDSLSATDITLAQSRLNCVGLCSARDGCTACTYLPNGTCAVYSDDVSAHDCQTTETDGKHYKKMIDTPSTICQNGGVLKDATTCQCQHGYVGDACERLMIDCSEGLQSGHYPTMSGFYQAQPSQASQPIQIRCNTYTQQYVLNHWRGDVNFNVSKASYVSGFGDPVTDYWMGLENLHLITSNPHVYSLAVQVANFSYKPVYQHYYDGFKVKGATEGYAMTFTSHRYASTDLPMGDCFTPLKDLHFSTYDDDNDNDDDRNCAADYGGGWWYRGGDGNCSDCNLVGQLRRTELTRQPGDVSEVFWVPGMPQDFSPYSVAMFLFRS